MRHPKLIIASIGVALAAAGGATAAVATSSAASSTPPAATAPAAAPGTAATVRIAHALVGGRTEAILTDANGRPLYFYQPDTATRSLVSGSLAALWPPLTSAAPAAAAGLGGKVTVVNDVHDGQVAYNGHLLYTFAGDRPGQVNGQGFQNFFVATPGIAPKAASPASTGSVPAAPPGGGYGGY
jgi:predicted lipoprotein with Yx(FWY)xxD motif